MTSAALDQRNLSPWTSSGFIRRDAEREQRLRRDDSAALSGPLLDLLGVPCWERLRAGAG